MLSWLDVLCICPSRSSFTPVRRFPPPGPIGFGSPASSVLPADSDFSCPFSRRFVAFASRYLVWRFVRSVSRRAAAVGLGYFFDAARSVCFYEESTRAPRFLEDPLV